MTMADMLVKLYEIPDDPVFLAGQEALGITIRKPFGPEKHLIIDWVRENFEEAWASEVDMALSNRPVSCFVALDRDTLAGFACYDATALGFFGPEGVDEGYRGRGIGKALLLACLLDMKRKGYGYAIIGDAGPQEFYARVVNAVTIPDSTPGIYKGLLRGSK